MKTSFLLLDRPFREEERYVGVLPVYTLPLLPPSVDQSTKLVILVGSGSHPTDHRVILVEVRVRLTRDLWSTE